MKSRALAYILWSLGAFGLGGLHRLYLGRKLSGWIYLATADLLFIGLLLDFKLIPEKVNRSRR